MKKRRRKRKRKPTQKSVQQVDEEILAEWTRQLQDEEKLGDAELVRSSGDEKMSDCLVEVLGDLINQVGTEEEVDKLITLAGVAWNASLLPDQGRTDFLASVMQDDVRDLIESLIRRKQLLFPEVRRYVVDVQVRVIDDDLYISVASADLR